MRAFEKVAQWLLRQMLGLLAASLSASIVVSLYGWAIHESKLRVEKTFTDEAFFFLLGVFVSFPHAFLWVLAGVLLFGTPILAVFKWKGITHWFAFASGGMFVGAASWILPWYMDNRGRRPPEPNLLESLLSSDTVYLFTAAGFFCGLTYWFVVYRKSPSAAVQTVTTGRSSDIQR